MVRKADSGWRDEMLAERYRGFGFPFPAAGMILPMIEYDKGVAVGLVSYQRAGDTLPRGKETSAAYRGFANLYSSRDGGQLPFLTAVYEPGSWAMRILAHNEAAQLLVGKGWAHMTERQFATVLYTMRDKILPDLAAYGVEWNTLNWSVATPPFSEAWPGELMSRRRRAYEPSIPVPFKLRVPCMDVDLAVVDVDDRIALVADFKRHPYGVHPRPTDDYNARALSSLALKGGPDVAAFLVAYAPQPGRWNYNLYPLNTSARSLLSYTLGSTGAGTKQLADAIAGNGWLPVAEPQWLDVLKCARDL